jgi:hypothetical protein
LMLSALAAVTLPAPGFRSGADRAWRKPSPARRVHRIRSPETGFETSRGTAPHLRRGMRSAAAGGDARALRGRARAARVVAGAVRGMPRTLRGVVVAEGVDVLAAAARRQRYLQLSSSTGRGHGRPVPGAMFARRAVGDAQRRGALAPKNPTNLPTTLARQHLGDDEDGVGAVAPSASRPIGCTPTTSGVRSRPAAPAPASARCRPRPSRPEPESSWCVRVGAHSESGCGRRSREDPWAGCSS